MNPRKAVPVEGDLGKDAGLSLIELIVAVVVSMIVVAAIASVFINSWLAQSDVLSTSEATNRGQLVGSAVEKAMRNALYFEVLEGGAKQVSGSELRVRTTLAGELECQAFHIADGVAEMKSSNADVHLATWGSWLDVTNYDAFVVNVDAPGAGTFSQTPTTGVGTTLTYNFAVETDSAPVNFNGEVSVRAGETGNGGCW